MNNYVGYYRVSTEEQGNSGLGLSSQKSAVNNFALTNGILLSEYQDVESGSSESRYGIERAIEDCRRTNATLLVKELSRITRGGFKYRQMLEENNINYIEVNSPHDPELVKEIKFSLAKEERNKIRERTKDSLNQIKDKLIRGEKHVSKSGRVITSLGTPENLTKEGTLKSIEVRKQKALNNPNNKRAGVLIVELREKGCTYQEIANRLNEYGFKASKGGKFSDTQVIRLYNRYKNN